MVYGVHQMSVNIHCHVYAAMAELALDIFGMFTLSNEEAGVGVPEVMKPNPGQPGSSEGREEASIK